MFAMKNLADGLEIANIDCRQDGMKVGAEYRAGYLFNTTIAGIEDADALVIVGANPRWEASLVNARIRKQWLTGDLKVAVIGQANDLTYRYDHLGTGAQALKELAEGQGEFAQILRDAENPMIIIGSDAISGADGAAVLHTCRKIAEDCGMVKDGWNGFNILHRAASRVAGMDMKFLPGEGGLDRDGILAAVEGGEVEFVWLMGADELPMDRLSKAFVVYQGHHGDAGAAAADVILPGAAYTEKDGTYVNLEGRAQTGRRAVFPPGEAKEDWAIIRAFSDVIGKTLPFNNLGKLRAQMVEAIPTLGEIDEISAGDWGVFGTEGTIADRDFTSPVEDFYLDNAICRASAVMAECSRALLHGGDAEAGATGTDG
jgi:NADH-quinone oxidoreductase subunit G